jgi:DGQHR domain-containing protein
MAVKIVRQSHPRTRASYPALLLRQNQQRFYFATIPVDDLYPFVFVSRRDEDPQDGFQRALNEDRADDIARYLSSGRGSIPTNIVLSAQENAGLTYDRRTKSILFSRVSSAFLVLDGQHRLWGYQKCKTRHRVPVAVYSGLTRADETRLFIDINTTQRGVPAALLLDIKQLARIEDERELILRSWFDQLKRDPKSSLAGKLSPAKSVTGKISRVTFNSSIGPVLQSTTALELDNDGRYRLIRNYINAFESELVEKKQITRSAYLQAMFEVFDEVVRAAIAKHANAKEESLREVIRPLTKIDLSSARGGQTRVSKTAIASAFKAALRDTVSISEEML